MNGGRHRSTKSTPTDFKSLDMHLSTLDDLRTNGAMRAEEKHSILRVFFTLHREKQNHTINNRAGVSVRARERTARLSGRGIHTVNALVRKYIRAETNAKIREIVCEDNKRGNFDSKAKRFIYSDKLFCEVRDFVQNKRANRECVTATNVLHYMIEKNYISVKSMNSKQYDAKDCTSAKRSVQRYLKRMGFKRGYRKGTVEINPQYIAQRNYYLRELFTNRCKVEHERLLEAYTDESYVHHHHRIDHMCLHHPDTDENSDKAPRKGRRISFVAAICNGGHSMPAGLIPGTVWHFTPKNSRDHKGDYHKVFNAPNYFEWFESQLLPNLYQPSLIILDNAEYHRENLLIHPNRHS